MPHVKPLPIHEDGSKTFTDIVATEGKIKLNTDAVGNEVEEGLTAQFFLKP